MINGDHVIKWLRSIIELLSENKDYLTDLDAEIGDADHGINMDRGFRKVESKLTEFNSMDIGSILRATGMTLISSVCGASGPLYGTFFMKAGIKATGKYELTLTDLVEIFQAGLSGLIERGRAQIGDKTMIDALYPGIDSLKKDAEDGLAIDQALPRAVSATENGMKATISMIAKKGRASYLGERSIGHQDPGATSSYLILKALQNVFL